MPPGIARREVRLSLAALAITVGASLLVGQDLWGGLRARLALGAPAPVLEQAVFVTIAAVLLYGNFAYQMTRLGYLRRCLAHRPVRRRVLERIHDRPARPLLLLVPAYKEEAAVVRQTLLSAALQEHPRRHVVLLIDDPPQPADAESARALASVRQLPHELATLLAKPAARLARSLADFEARAARGLDRREETLRLAELYAEASGWLRSQAEDRPPRNHAEALFAEQVLLRPARSHLTRTLEFESRARAGRPLPARRIAREYRRLAALFRVEITSFERKRYENLSHAPNKAMNLNSYLGLLGRSWREVVCGDRLRLLPAPSARAHLHVPDAAHVVTLDADSLLAWDYVLTLLHEMERPGNERLAVVQTPYSAVPAAAGVLERLAGATTDVQHVIHQGFTRHDATYWVGANALLRRAALEDLRQRRRERGFEVSVFVQDRTVIEDTESSIDLVARGWRLHNHPERMAWSATPPDFGALLIQRRRWANGGLLILPKLLRVLLRRPWRVGRLAEGFLRAHYLVSIAAVNLGLAALFLLPFEGVLESWWFPVAALPYFALYARDLAAIGYRARDVVGVYALNLLLLPVNLGGVAKSLSQAVTGRKGAFGRTPKVRDRTAVPRGYLLAEWAFLAGLLGILAADLLASRWVHAGFVGVNAVLLAWALWRLLGWRETLEDLRPEGAATASAATRLVA